MPKLRSSQSAPLHLCANSMPLARSVSTSAAEHRYMVVEQVLVLAKHLPSQS